jgi:hypothetical protein
MGQADGCPTQPTTFAVGYIVQSRMPIWREAAVDLTARKRIRALRSSQRGLRRARTAASAPNVRLLDAAAQ